MDFSRDCVIRVILKTIVNNMASSAGLKVAESTTRSTALRSLPGNVD